MKHERPFVVKRSIKKGAIPTDAALVVDAEWTELNVANVSANQCDHGGMITIKGCSAHRGGKGHHMTDGHGWIDVHDPVRVCDWG